MSGLAWQVGTVVSITTETPHAKSFTLSLPQWHRHRAGQHYTLRLTAPDGYQAQRSYSIASPPEQTGEVAFTVELIEEGEVSGYLFDGVQVGDQLEVRGPIGGYFVWDATPQAGPLLLVAGGSGVVPLMCMLRHRQRSGLRNPTVLLYSVRTPEEVIYQQELLAMAQADPSFSLVLTYTRQSPAGWTGNQRRLDAAMLQEAVGQLPTSPQCFICGPTGLVESAATLLAQHLQVPTAAIHTERFGPSGT
ncbi:ferredoxin reductase [Hymenobacter fodinae]|uniref:Oxidoreductase n=1 Tax=Hymenobacter fodinae TaxID=2510796 RepID=A0A4Z0NZG2_9BACT|nr:ferredoxin reductase [Hymenobacter fodinae]TGE04092.1 oxidoreductase [Hymenobacter fodinae]